MLYTITNVVGLDATLLNNSTASKKRNPIFNGEKSHEYKNEGAWVKHNNLEHHSSPQTLPNT